MLLWILLFLNTVLCVRAFYCGWYTIWLYAVDLKDIKHRNLIVCVIDLQLFYICVCVFVIDIYKVKSYGELF